MPDTTTTRPGKIVCIGRNYREHAKELGNEVPTEPLFFLKPPSSIIAGGQPIVLPEQSERVEFEGEIGVVIGAPLTRASESEAERAVGGVLALNDVTARDLQKKDSRPAPKASIRSVPSGLSPLVPTTLGISPS